MGGPSYSSKWRCKECGQLYGHNPSECDICSHTLFEPLPADGVGDDFDGGEHITELGADISELTNNTSDTDSVTSSQPSVSEQHAKDSEMEQSDEKKSEQQERASSLIERLRDWVF